uniref:Uncharacterized protein n=1 Tax=Solanum tuberosum TaxID=4113 RepID=M1DT03_SOLTU
MVGSGLEEWIQGKLEEANGSTAVKEVKACIQKEKNTFSAPRSQANPSKKVVGDGSQFTNSHLSIVIGV